MINRVFLLLPLVLFLQVDNNNIKSAFICHMASFVKWSNLVENEFKIGIFGDSPDGKLIIPADKKIFDKKVALYKITNYNQLPNCRVVYVCADQEANIPNILSALNGREVLTISATKGFVDKGIMINLYQEEQRVVFEINKKIVDNNRLQLSSKLFQLAKRII